MAERVTRRARLSPWEQLLGMLHQAERDLADASERINAADKGLEYFFKSVAGQSLRFKGHAALLYFTDNPIAHPHPNRIVLPADFYKVGHVGQEVELNSPKLMTVSLQPEQPGDIERYVAFIREIEPATAAEVRRAQNTSPESTA